MTPGLLFFALRLGLALLLYAFLATLLYFVWQDLRTAERSTAARARRLGRLLVVESTLPAAPPGTEFPLLAVTALGRAPTNTVSLPDDTISIEHALLHQRDGQWWVEDLASRNGTRLNDALLSQPAVIVPGDVIGLGQVRLRLELE
jgi:hypothetical protein